jgi:hypothetical protein
VPGKRAMACWIDVRNRWTGFGVTQWRFLRHSTRVKAMAILTGIGLLWLAAPAQAQENPVEVSAGYSLLYVRDPLPVGFVLGIERQQSRAVVIVVQATGNYGLTLLSGNSGLVDVSHALVGGVRLGHRGADFSPFIQLLAGPVRESGSGPSETNIAVQPGAGVDVRIDNRRRLRLQGDYRSILASPSHTREYRVTVGAVLRLGR